MALCDRCKNKCKFMLKNKTLDTCGLFEKQTNFDRITKTSEALAEFLGEYAMPPCGHIVLCKECPLNGKSCLDNNVATDKDAWLVWLKQESE